MAQTEMRAVARRDRRSWPAGSVWPWLFYAWIVLSVGGQLSGAAPADEPPTASERQLPLEIQIDRAVESLAVGPLAGQCGDSDFLRRIYLDLTGVIPTVEQARAFLADKSPEKRRRVIDELLSSSGFSRHIALQLNVILLERRTEKNVKQQDWERYLYESISRDKPLDQLFSELIFIQPPESGLHPATKFIFNRDVEPNALTRDVGRLVFGMDLQCAQCHNHPLIDAYLQEDYYGLFAFLNRTNLFTNPTSKEVRLAEKADGEVSFKSVFTGDSRDRMNPRLPKEFSLFAEPTFADGDPYRIKPDKLVAGQPKFSRREALAKMLSRSEQFQLNLANRLWALMFSRGIVHPLDFHHVGNSPNNPDLLKILAGELKNSGFQLRPLIRAIALSRTYQRSCEAPLAETVNFSDVSARYGQLDRMRASLLNAIDAHKESAAKAEKVYSQLLRDYDNQALEIAKQSKAVVEARQELDKASSAHKSAAEALDKLSSQSRVVAEAAGKTLDASRAIADDKVLSEAAAKLAERAAQLASKVEAASKAQTEKSNQLVAARASVDRTAATLASAQAAQVDAERLKDFEQGRIDTAQALSRARYTIHAIEWRMALCKSLEQYRSAEQTEPAKAESQWQSIVEQWTIAGQVAPLKPLSPEQLTASSMQATGMLAPQIAAVEEKLEKSTPEAIKAASDADKQRLKSAFVQLDLIDALRSTIGQFETHYGGLPGEDFQATVNQSLFFGNGSLVESWLKPGGDNLASRLSKLAGKDELVDELYLAVLSRPALESEKREIIEFLRAPRGQSDQAVSEVIWALLSSSEFRFNH